MWTCTSSLQDLGKSSKVTQADLPTSSSSIGRATHMPKSERSAPELLPQGRHDPYMLTGKSNDPKVRQLTFMLGSENSSYGLGRCNSLVALAYVRLRGRVFSRRWNSENLINSRSLGIVYMRSGTRPGPLGCAGCLNRIHLSTLVLAFRSY